MKPDALALLLCSVFLCCSNGGPPSQMPLEGENGITAGYKRDAVEHLALTSDSTLKLMFVSTGAMNVDGTSKSWSFMYCRTVSPHTFSYFTATFDSVVFDSSSSKVREGAAIITQAWINSCVAAQIAERNGGEAFRSSSPDCSIHANVGEAVVPNPVVMWKIVYRSNTDPDRYRVFTIDARTVTANRP